jgi:hypothetical protein
MRQLRIVIIIVCCLVIIYPLIQIGLSHFTNQNSLEVTTSTDLNIQDIKIELSIWGSDVVDRVMYENGSIEIIPEEYGENDWYLSYKNKHTSFRHFKTNNRADHDYDFHFFEENDTVKCKINIDGHNPKSMIVLLDKSIKTDVGAELGLRIKRD